MRLLLPAVAAVGILFLYDGLTMPSARRRRRFRGWLDRLAAESGIRGITGRHLGWAVTATAATAFVLVAGLTGSLPVALGFGALAGWSPVAFARSRRNDRREKFRAAWPDAITTLISAVRAGISLPDACSQLAQRGPEDLRDGFASFASAYKATGSFQAALARARGDFADPVADRVIAALTLAHDVGGSDLVRVLRTLGDFVRDDLRVRREIQARWSWTVTAARVASAAPWIVLLLMTVRPEAAVAYGSPVGLVVIASGAVATIAGYRLMLRVARLPEERRLG
jgi:tight adherence protein B